MERAYAAVREFFDVLMTIRDDKEKLKQRALLDTVSPLDDGDPEPEQLAPEVP